MDGARLKPVSHHRRKHRVTPPAVQERHRSGHYFSSPGRQPASLHEIVTFAQLLDEPRHLEKIVAVVGIAHDDVPAACRRDAAHQRVAVTLGLDWTQARAPVSRAISCEPSVLPLSATITSPAILLSHERAPGLADAGGQRVSLVEAWHHHRDFDGDKILTLCGF